jgi:putative ABC transport system permease protein
MLKNLILIAFRNIRKDKTYSFLNVAGLTIGITCSVFLLLYILDELSFDRYHDKADRIYRVVSNIKEPDNAFTWAVAQVPLAEELRTNYSDVENAVRFFGMGRQLIVQGTQEFYEEDFFQVDSTVFDVFSYAFLHGDPSTALDKPNAIVITEKIARKYFSKTDVVGQTLQVKQGDNFQITGVMRDVPHNSHFRFDALVSRVNQPPANGWGGFGVFTYLLLPDGYNSAQMQTHFAKILKEKVEPIFTQYGITVQYELQPITAIHLHSKIQDEAEEGGDITIIYIFAAIAIFMLIIASINYMNLATARSANRAKEVGIRKVMGSQRSYLIAQFITESVVLSGMALVISVLLIYALLPFFNQLASKELPFSYILQLPVFLSLLGIVVLVGVVGGSYPAFYLSAFNPVSVLKGKLASRGGSALFRKSLVVVQFSISIFMLISTFIVYNQLQFMRSKDLGFVKERLIRLDLSTDEMIRKSGTLSERMKQTEGVMSAATSFSGPGENIGKLLLQIEDNEGKLSERGVDLFNADHDFVKTMGMTIVEGRDFSREISSDTVYAVLVNEAMVKRMSWDNPIGKKFIATGAGPNNTDVEKRVVGVLKDYHQNSLYDAIEPLMIILSSNNGSLFIRTAEGDVRKSLASIERTWNEVNPGYPFMYTFLDQDFNSQYRADEKRSQIFTAFSGLTIFIACLGLLGLSAFTTQQRTKEIGVRKVIGASPGQLVYLVSKEFFFLVAIGTVLAFPLAWYFTDHWLQSFAYRIELNHQWLTFLLSAFTAFLITFLTVGFHVLRATSANPVKALRDE